MGRRLRRVAKLPRRPPGGSGTAEEESGRHRSRVAPAAEGRVSQDLLAATGDRGRARGQRFLQRMPHADPAGVDAATEAERARLLRRLPPDPLSGETRILTAKAFVDGASSGNPG